jgi:chromosome segregation ATPase
LRETLSGAKKELESCTEKIKQLRSDVEKRANQEDLLQKQIDQLQISVASLPSVQATAKMNEDKVLELTAVGENLRQEIDKLKNEKVENLATVASLDERKNSLLHQKEELQVSLLNCLDFQN